MFNRRDDDDRCALAALFDAARDGVGGSGRGSASKHQQWAARLNFPGLFILNYRLHRSKSPQSIPFHTAACHLSIPRRQKPAAAASCINKQVLPCPPVARTRSQRSSAHAQRAPSIDHYQSNRVIAHAQQYGGCDQRAQASGAPFGWPGGLGGGHRPPPRAHRGRGQPPHQQQHQHGGRHQQQCQHQVHLPDGGQGGAGPRW